MLRLIDLMQDAGRTDVPDPQLISFDAKANACMHDTVVRSCACMYANMHFCLKGKHARNYAHVAGMCEACWITNHHTVCNIKCVHACVNAWLVCASYARL